MNRNRTIILLLAFFSIHIAFAQKKSSVGMSETDKLVNQGTAKVDGKEYNSLVFKYEGALPNLIEQFEDDLSKSPVIVQKTTLGTVLQFRKATMPDWTENKFTFYLSVVGRNDINMVSISCFDKNNDYLEPGSETQQLITTYLEGFASSMN